MPSRKPSKPKPLKQTSTGIASVDALSVDPSPTLQTYLNAVSEYVRDAPTRLASPAKGAQIALSSGLGRVLRSELVAKVPRMDPHAGELNVAGALRTARADVSEAHHLDGLRLAVEIKPVNLAVGRAIWNRFGDVRAFAVNIHLKFPFAVVGGVLAVPTWEWAKETKAMSMAAAEATGVADDLGDSDDAVAEGDEDVDEADETEDLAATAAVDPAALYKKSTLPLVNRLITRLQRTRRRETEADAAHLLEAVAVIVYDPDTGELSPDLPPPGSDLRWDEFVTALAETYDVRFED
ncbi:MAG TPA: hypothetical protein VF519_01430 [Mycobacteriales bacterium]|jgi:hypothetical protein